MAACVKRAAEWLGSGAGGAIRRPLFYARWRLKKRMVRPHASSAAALL